MKRKKINTDPAERLSTLFSKWQAGADVTDEVETILKNNPEWRHKPPGRVGRTAYIMWTEWTGYEIHC